LFRARPKKHLLRKQTFLACPATLVRMGRKRTSMSIP